MADNNALQAMLDGMSAQWQRQRASSGATLGSLIQSLESLPPDRLVVGIGSAASYRGYYADLAFDPDDQADDEPRTVADLLAECRSAMGKVFEGYKGGEYVMGERTPVWIAPWGHCGSRLVGLNTSADVVTPLTRDGDD